MSAFGGVVLPSLLDRGFAEHMRTYFTRETYLAEHVRVQQLKIRMEPPAPYTWDPDPDDGLMRAWAGLSVDVARELVELARWHADEGPTYPPRFKGFYAWPARPPAGASGIPRNNSSHPPSFEGCSGYRSSSAILQTGTTL